MKAFGGSFGSVKSVFHSFWKCFEETRWLNGGRLALGSTSALYLLLDDCGTVLAKTSISVCNLHHPRHSVFSCLVMLSVFAGLMRSLQASKCISESKLKLVLAQVKVAAVRPNSSLRSAGLLLEDLHSLCCLRPAASRPPQDTAPTFAFNVLGGRRPATTSKPKHANSPTLPSAEEPQKKVGSKLQQVTPVLLKDTNN